MPKIGTLAVPFDDLLRWALIGLEAEHVRLRQIVVNIESQLPAGKPRAAVVTEARTHKISAAGRAAIAAAQRKRWASHHRQQKLESKVPPKRRPKTDEATVQ